MQICAACQEKPKVLTKDRGDIIFFYVGWTCGAWLDRASFFENRVDAEKFLADYTKRY